MADRRTIIGSMVRVVLALAALLPATAFAQSVDPDDPPPTERSQPTAAKSRDPRTLAPSEFNLSVVGGRGLIRTMSPYTLDPGKVGVSVSAMNFDRNPGDTDFFEFPFSLVLGLPGRTEVFLRASPVLRTNSVGLEPLGFPFPPLDLFVDTYPSPANRLGPMFLFAQEVPFKSYDFPTVVIDPPGHGSFSSSSGSVALGGKVNLLSEDRENRLGLGLRAYVEIPTEKPRYNTIPYHERAGLSGKTDMGVDLLAAKRFAITELLVNVGYKHVGDPERGIRVQFVDSSRADAGFLVGQPQEIKLDLHDRIDLGVGAAFPAFAIMQRQIWLLTEFNYTRYIGHGVPVERLVHPAELRLGLQLNFPWYKPVALGMAFQLLLNDGGNGDLRTTFLRTPDGKGDINFGENVDPRISADVEAFLASRGGTFSPSSSKVFSTNNPDFDAWRNIVTAPQQIISQGNGNILAFITWRIN